MLLFGWPQLEKWMAADVLSQSGSPVQAMLRSAFPMMANSNVICESMMSSSQSITSILCSKPDSGASPKRSRHEGAEIQGDMFTQMPSRYRTRKLLCN